MVVRRARVGEQLADHGVDLNWIGGRVLHGWAAMPPLGDCQHQS